MSPTRSASLALSLAILSACAAPVINYTTISVPEEGGVKFTQYTVDEENLVYPVIQRNEISGILEWYAAPLIAVSADGTRLAFIGRKNEKANIFIKNTEGGRSTIQRTFRERVGDVSFSPDGSKLAFSDISSDDSNIFLINASEGAAVQQITSTTQTEVGPNFSPDGQTIYFSKSDGGRYYVWSVNLSTWLLTQYAEGFTPVIAKNGQELVITRNNKTTLRGEIWLINLQKGTETLVLSDENRGFSSPQISPDGSVIVCVGTSEKSASAPENLNIFTVKPDGTSLTQLTFHPGHDVSPVWGPDGQSIYFISQRGNPAGNYNLWKMNFSNR